MFESGTDPELYAAEYALVYEDYGLGSRYTSVYEEKSTCSPIWGNRGMRPCPTGWGLADLFWWGLTERKGGLHSGP